jgi:hypothetical protein
MYNFIIGPTDTDSISFCKPDMTPFSLEEQKHLIDEINEISPEWMDWDKDGYYEACLVLKAKNYILVENGKYKYRGSSLRDTKKEPALIEMLHQMIGVIISEQQELLPEIYKAYIKEALNISFMTRWQFKKTVTKSVLNPERLTEQKVLDAMNETIKLGIQEKYQEGDKIWLYNSVNGMKHATAKGELIYFRDGRPKLIPNYILKDIRLWNKDEDKMHYVSRVYDTVQILANVIDMNQFIDYTLKKNTDLLKELDK